MRFKRAAGILLHPTSLPGRYGVGDLGPQAYGFVDLLKKAGQTYWQILPLGPTGLGDSPYSSFSAFGGNTLLISSEKLIDDGLVSNKDLAELPEFTADRVDYGAVHKFKAELLHAAFENFPKLNGSVLASEFEQFCEEEKIWLDDFALFFAIRKTQANKPWYEWPDKFKLRDSRTMEIAAGQLVDEIREQKFYQFLFFRQWSALREYANESGIKVIGDIPIFVSLDSADVWCGRSDFKLNEDGSPTVVSGVPPDYFSATGQLWGNPIYDWDAMQANGFAWWIERFRHTLKMVDIVRVDHFRGFVAAWEVPGTDETAENGKWVSVPGRELFTAVKQKLGDLPVIAEDLGVLTPDVEALRDEFGFPGMRILQYAFSGDARNRDLPHNYVPNAVAYTGTHDNDTTVGWWNNVDSAAGRERDYCLEYLASDGPEINWALIRLLYSSVADIAIVPLQDVLGLESESRMNTPATDNGNWQWRFAEGSITDNMVAKLKDLAETYGRI